MHFGTQASEAEEDKWPDWPQEVLRQWELEDAAMVVYKFFIIWGCLNLAVHYNILMHPDVAS
jgi:hypothetical protein